MFTKSPTSLCSSWHEIEEVHACPRALELPLFAEINRLKKKHFFLRLNPLFRKEGFYLFLQLMMLAQGKMTETYLLARIVST